MAEGRAARELPAHISVRRVRAEDWQLIRDLRLEALHDPMARVAFLETVEQAEARPGEEWRSRAAAHSEGNASAQFLAESGTELIGSVAVIVRSMGVPDYFDRVPDVDLPTVVGVYVSPRGRGLGVIDALLAAAAHWAEQRGDRELTLDVHESNSAAIRAYQRAGFEVRSEFVSESGRELGMVKPLPARNHGWFIRHSPNRRLPVLPPE
ncbi:MAG TPA: GNAT family N-acetyltransferase [Pseudolysinimonas sp.]|nr:GNAT family N-acetyltransferase [Pseudolysinimonas sp.]